MTWITTEAPATSSAISSVPNWSSPTSADAAEITSGPM
jgi:hypothetical protein